MKTSFKDVKRDFAKFVKKMEEGITVGYKKYGDEGLFGDSQLEMIEEELRDQAVYSFLAYLKIQLLKRKMCKLKDLKEITGKVSKNKFGRTK